MRLLLPILCLLYLTLICACKKESDFSPPDTGDYSGRYYISGFLESDPSGFMEKKTFSITSGQDSASGSTCELVTNYFAYQGYKTASSVLIENLRSRHFLPIFFGGTVTNASGSGYAWTAAELDSIFQVGKKLPFGKAVGQVQIEFSDAVTLPGSKQYSSETADNSGTYILIEQVEDVADEFDSLGISSPKWAKIITFSFGCHLRAGEPPYDEIGLTNCRASMLLKPAVQ